MILSVTLNPVVDTTFFVPEVRHVYRTEATRVTHLTGGKGTNVTRALRCLGEDAAVLIALGGKMGWMAADTLREEGLDATVAWISGETRLMVTLVDANDHQQAFFAPNTPFSPRDFDTIRQEFSCLVQKADNVCVCGSSPAPEADELFAYVIREAARNGCPTLLDSSGGGLRAGLSARPTVVKVNLAEAEGLLGRPLPTQNDWIHAVEDLRSKSGGWAIITLGDKGALMSPADGEHWIARAPSVKVINPIGCGDAMTAGLVWAMTRGKPPQECFRWATAVAAANAMTWTACVFDPLDADGLLPNVVLERV